MFGDFVCLFLTSRDRLDLPLAGPGTELDGYGWIKKAIRRRGQDPEMEFAAALIGFNGPEPDHRISAERRWPARRNDSLLVQNLASDFHNQTISELLTHPPGRKD